MDYWDPHQAEWALQDPSTPGEVLAAIAQAHPALRDRVVAHPNAYPQLVVWIAAQSTSTSASVQSVAGPTYAAQPYGPAGQPYGQQAQGFPMQPSGPGQPYGGPGGYPPVKKKTGLIFGLVGGGVVAVVAVVAVLGLFVFHWFGGSSGSGPTLTKSQTESFLDSDFMQGMSDGMSAEDYSHRRFSASDFFDGDSPDCQGLVDIMAGVDTWSSWSGSLSAERFPKNVSPDSFIGAATRCEAYGTSDDDADGLSVHPQDGGWWITSDDEDGVTFVYGNVWVILPDVSDDEAADLFKDFVPAVDAAAK